MVPVAHADNGVDAQTYKPALDPGGIFSVEGADGMPEYNIGLTLGLDFAVAPLKLAVENIGTPGSRSNILDSQFTIDVGLAFGVTDRITFAFDVPINHDPLGDGYGKPGNYRAISPTDPQFQPGTGFYSVRPDENVPPSENPPGDPRVSLKWRAWSSGAWAVAGQFIVHVPFGDEDVFAGSEWFTYEPKIIVERRLGGKGMIALNLGARLREGALIETRDVDAQGFIKNDAMGNPVYLPLLYVGSEGLVSAGARYQVTDRVGLGAEAYALIPLATSSECGAASGCRNGDFTADVLGGAFLGVGQSTTLSLSAGLGVISSAPRQDSFRVLAGLAWTPSSSGKRTESFSDRDGDGIPDIDDQCPDEPEDFDGFQDADGCPDPDNDGDGIPDKLDLCPNDPEDKDGYQDADGCPDPDNDGDGIPDVDDQCPNDPEDFDGFQDADGCPDADNDGDGIPDKLDKCPNEPEDFNGYQDADGCPDQAPGGGGPKLAADRIDLGGDRVEFVEKTAKLAPSSLGALDAVARILVANPTIHFRIEVGVELGNEGRHAKEADLRLTTDRARAIQAYLGEKGVKPSQIDAAGLGSDRPIDAKKPKDPRLNRRVDFIRVNQ